MPELQTLLKEVVKLPASYRQQGAPLASLLAQVAKGDDGHGQRVGRLAGLLGHLAKTGLSSSALELAGRLHDAGKLLLPDSLLNHPGMFNDRQMLVMRQHPSLGLGALFHLSADIPTLVHEAVLLHHERYDGDGYPFGLKGKAIPLAARIIGLVDVIDALLSARAYKTGWTPRQVKAFLHEQAGGAFDPDLVRHATTFFEDLLAIRRSVAQPVQGYQSVPCFFPYSQLSERYAMMPLPLPPAAHAAPSEASSLKLLAGVADRLFAENRRDEGLCVIDALYLQADAAFCGSRKPCGQEDG